MAHSNKLKVQVLSALAAGKSYSELTAEFGVSSSTVRAWEGKGKKSLKTATQTATSPLPPPPTASQLLEQRNAIISKAVLDDIAQARSETIAELLKLRKLAIRRMEDSMLPLRRRRVQHENGERVELDPSYSPPKVDLVGALYMLDGILGIRANEQSSSDDAPPAEVEVHIVREEQGDTIQLPQQAKPTGT